jgi:hypothetical protein
MAPCGETCSCIVDLTWKAPVPATGVTGYVAYYTTDPNQMHANGPFDAYNNLTLTVPTKFCSGTYYFVVAASLSSGGQTGDSLPATAIISNQTMARSANIKEIRISIPEGRSFPPPAVIDPSPGSCPSATLDQQVMVLFAEAQKASQEATKMTNPDDVHATVRVTRVALVLGTGPSISDTDEVSALSQLFIGQLCNGHTGCDVPMDELQKIGPERDWSLEIDWTCDHMRDAVVNQVVVPKNIPFGSFPIRCSGPM